MINCMTKDHIMALDNRFTLELNSYLSYLTEMNDQTIHPIKYCVKKQKNDFRKIIIK